MARLPEGVRRRRSLIGEPLDLVDLGWRAGSQISSQISSQNGVGKACGGKALRCGGEQKHLNNSSSKTLYNFALQSATDTRLLLSQFAYSESLGSFSLTSVRFLEVKKIIRNAETNGEN